MTRYNYNRQLTPPAPFAHVSVRPPVGGRGLADLPAQLDSGADLSVIPWEIVERLHLVQLDEAAVVGFGGSTLLVPTFLVEMTVRGFRPVVVRALASRSESYVLLGRDVLNEHRLLLDGPQLILEIN